MMVTQEDGHLTSEEEEIAQQRRSLMAAAIRRGEVKISEPILWVEGVPDASSTQRPVSTSVEPDAGLLTIQDPNGDHIPGIAVSTDDLGTTFASGEGPPLRHKHSSEGIREAIQSQNLSTLVDETDGKSEHKRSIFVEEDMASPSPVSQEKKKARRSGTIRTVFRKVFGRKEKRNSKVLALSPPQSRAGPKHEYTRSDPLPSTRPNTSPDQKGRNISSQNAIAPLQDVEADDYSTHTPQPPTLPFPMNVNAPQEPSPDRQVTKSVNYISFETGPRVHRRRATLPSMIISPQDAASLQRLWSSPDLAPISASDRSPSQGMPSPHIGIAISSGGANPNRRSRSAGALHELAKQHEQFPNLRRRSSEIKYWRASKIDSQQDDRRPNTPEASPCRSTKASSIAPTRTEVSEALADTGSSIHEDQLHSFDFGAENTESATAEQAAIIVEHRLSQLEINMHRMSISLQNATRSDSPPEREFTLKPAPHTHGSQHSLGAAPRVGLGLQATPQPPISMRFTQPRPAPSPSPSKTSLQQSFLNSPTTAAATASPQAVNLIPQQPVQYPAAPSSVHSAPQFSANPPISQTVLFEHIAPLYEALRWERQSRKALEAQVQQLRSDVVELSAVVSHLRGQATHVKNASPSPPLQAPAVKHHKGFSAVANGERSRFSGYDSDDDECDAPRVSSPQEDWTTPREEQSRQWGSAVEGGYI